MWGKDIRAKTYKTGGQVLMIPVEEIRPNPDQPRREFDQGKLLELAQSIGGNGMIHPLTVMMWNGQPVLVAGERRLRAAKIAGIRTVPCLVTEARRMEAALLALVENLQREDMNCFEEAEGIHRLIGLYGLTQEEAAFRLGCSQPTIANKLRLLRLAPEERRQMIAAGLTERHARALLRLTQEEQRSSVLRRVIEDKLTVAQTERLVAGWLAGNPPRRRPMPMVRDVRVFFHTVDHAVDIMRRSGIAVKAERSETEDCIEYVVRIPKGAGKTVPLHRGKTQTA